MRSIDYAIAAASFIILSTAACQKHSAYKGDQATFLVLPVTAEEIQTATTDGEYNLPKSRTLRIKACIQDLGLVQPIVGQTFHVDGGAQPVESKTDSNGCLYWKDSVDFNYLGKEEFVHLQRTIVAERPHRGEVQLDLAIDPWKTSSDALVDLRYGQTQALGAASDSAASDSKLVIQEIQARFFNQQFSSSGLSVSGQFSFKPLLARIGYDGQEVQEPLTQGAFSLELTLIEKPRVGNQGQPRVLAQRTVDVQAVSAFAETQVDFQLERVPSQYSIIELAFRLSPKAAQSLAPEEGLLEMDQLLAQGTFPKEAFGGGPNAPNSYDAYLQAFKSAPQAEASSSTSAFQFDRVQVDFGGVQKTTKNENVPAQVGVQITACIKSSVDLKPVFNFPFEVAACTDASHCASFQPGTSDPQGCLHWQDQISFDYFAGEKWLARQLVVRSATAPFEGQSSAFTVYVDPWQTGSLFQWDSRNGAPPASAPASAGSASAARLDIAGFVFNFTGRSFQVDANMNLIVHRKFQFQITPAIRREGSLSDGLAYDSVKAGKYRLRALLMSSPDSGTGPAEPISLYSGAVEAIDGTITANVEFPFALSEMPLIGARGQLVLELSDLAAASSLKPGTVVSPFQALDNSGEYGVTRSGATVDQLLAKAPQGTSVSQLAASGASLYFQKGRTGSVDSLFQAVTGMSKLGDPGLGPIAGGSGELPSDSLSRLCGSIFPETLKQVECRLAPQRYLTATRFVQVDSITGTPIEVSGDTYVMNVSSFVAYTENQGQTASKQLNFWTGVSGGVEGSLGVDVLGNGGKASIGWRTNAGWAILHSWDKTKMNTNQVSVVEMKSLNAEALNFQIPAKVRQCVAVKPVDAAYGAGHYFCEAGVRAETIPESWYYVMQPRSLATSLQDLGNLADNGWMKVIRGRRQFTDFRKMLTDGSKALVFEHDDGFLNASKTFGKSFGGLSGVVPMLDDSNLPGVVSLAQ